jgi:hypothetical protein
MALGVLLGLCALMFHKVLLAGPDQILGGLDVINSCFNYKTFTKEALLSGNLPLWNPYYFGGHPFIGNSVASPFYPPDIIFLFLPVARAINLSYFMHFFLAGAFMYFWLKQFESSATSLCGAIIFMFCGYFLARLPAGHFFVMRTTIYLPLMFALYESFLKSGDRIWIILGGLVVGIQILCGHPQVIYYSLLFLGLYALCRCLADFSQGRLRVLAKYILPYTIMVCLGMATAAVTLLPTIELFSASVRSGVTGWERFVTDSVVPLHFIRFFFPDTPLSGVVRLSHSAESACYIGILPLFLISLGLKSRKKRTTIFASLILLCILLALGRYTPLSKAIYHIIPGIRLFRIHSRALIVCTFFAATLAGMGMGTLVEMFGKKKAGLAKKTTPLIWSLVVSTIFLLIISNFNIVFMLMAGERDFLTPSIILPLLFISLTTFAIWLIYLQKIPRKWLSPLIILIISADLILTGARHLEINRIPDYSRESSPHLKNLTNAPLGQFRVYFYHAMFPANHGMSLHMENLNGYNPVFLERSERFMEEMSGIKPFRSADDYMIRSKCFEQDNMFPFRILNIRYASAYDRDSNTFSMVENPNPFPRALWIQNAEVFSDPEDILKILGDDGFDPYQTVLLEKGTQAPRSSNLGGGSAPAKIEDYSINNIKLSLDAPTDGWVLFSEQFYPGWKAWCDGNPVEVYRADFILRAVPVPAGRHIVTMEYSPLSFKIGSIISLLAVFTILGFVVGPTAKHLLSKRSPQFLPDGITNRTKQA